MPDKKGKEVDTVDYDTKVLHKGLAVEEIVRCDEEVPGHRPEPGKVVHLVDSIPNVDYLGETLIVKYLNL